MEEGSCRAALRAALGVAASVTGLGPPCYEPAPIAGGGLVDAPASVMDTMFCDPHTGIIYTPPRFSDHVAVSCFLLDEVREDLLALSVSTTATAAMRHAQPHKHTAPITAFFKAASRPQGDRVVEGVAGATKRAADIDAGGGCSSDVQKRKVGKEDNVEGGKSALALKRLFQFGSKGCE